MTLSVTHVAVEEFWPTRLNFNNSIILSFLTRSIVDLLLCLESLSCCGTQFQPSFRCQIS